MYKEDAMMMRTILRIVLLSLLTGNIAGGVNKSMSQISNRSPFRYAIVSNEVIDDSGTPPKDAYRYVEVLLDEKAFSENNLKELFKLVSKRFPKPKVLHVQVYTNLNDVETPEEREGPKMSEVPDDPSQDRYHQASYLRDDDGNEWFTYNPNAPRTGTKKVILKRS
ncbi:MAG TPA: hypothetical protein VE135_20380 [Pyrinomonadaceae bacterium]|nr:hypothetical protein [Pyrinomonadaceae bacterium]